MKASFRIDPDEQCIFIEARGDLDLTPQTMAIPIKIWKQVTASLLTFEASGEKGKKNGNRIITLNGG